MNHKFGSITVYVEQDYDAMSSKAAEIFSEEINKHPEAAFGFATGGTPLGMYKQLIEMNKQKAVNFSGITTFNLDEYYPISRDNDQSYYYFMMTNLFEKVNIDRDKIHIPNGNAADINKECTEYEEALTASGGLRMQLLGIGLNGHIGFNEPSGSFSRATHCVQLDQSTCEANARFFTSVDDVPRQAITMGIGTIMMSESILLLANGKGKAEIIKKALTGPITPEVPASVLQLHRNVIVVLDKSAAEGIL